MWKVSILRTAACIACFSSVAQATTGLLDFFLGDAQRADLGFIKLRAVFTQRPVAVIFDVLKDLGHRTADAFRGGKVAGRISSSRCCSGLQLFQSIRVLKLMAITPSSSQLAAPELSWHRALSVFPSFQNRVSLLTMCMATRCWSPASGRMVGRSAPGSRAITSSRRSLGACIMMYLDSRA